MWTREGDVRYRVLRPLASGGMADVALAEDTVLGRWVALKRMRAGQDVRGLKRLRREAIIGASLNHPNLVSIYDIHEEDDGGVTIVMEYVAGDTLDYLIRTRGAIRPAKALRILTGLAAALDAVHARGIVHRDVKPANILLGLDGAVKLADLGIAAVDDHTKITTAGQVVGTFSYMAPEQLEGKASGPAVDVYALAAVAFEMLCGHRARREPNPVALAHAIATQPPRDLLDCLPSAPPAAAEVLKRGMARDPGRRPPSAGELVQRLRVALDLKPTRPPAPAPAVAAAAALAAAAVRPEPMPSPSRSVRPEPVAAAPAAEARPAVVARTARAEPAVAAPVARAAPAVAAPRARAEPAAAAPEAESEPVSAVPPPPPEPRRTHRTPPPRRSLAVAALLATLLLVGIGVASLSSGGGKKQTSARATGTSTSAAGAKRTHHAAHRATHRTAGTSAALPSQTSSSAANSSGSAATSSAATTSAPVASTPAPSAVPASPTAPTTPSAAVQMFYEAAAHHDYAAAWQLADANLRNQLQGYDSFRAQMSAVRVITFHQAQTVARGSSSATVALDTTAVLIDKTQHCDGTATTTRASTGAWLVDHLSISCTPV